MSAELVPFNLPNVRRMASRLSDLGYRVLRVRPDGKVPVDEGWPKKATDDPNVLDEWFKKGGPEFNIGIACGPQPNGKNLAVIDVDVNHGGMETWAHLLDINGHPDTATHLTPTNGLHYFFDCPFEVTNANNLPKGIDVRGLGGQVVVPPSWRMINGDVLHYLAKGGRGIDTYPVAPMSEWLHPLVRPIERSIERHPSQPRPATAGVENGDWLRDHWDWVLELEKLGYEVVKQVGEDIYLRHPEATNEHSCVVHLDKGWMIAFSSNMPSPLRPEKQYTADGFVKWSPLDWFTATQHGGSYSSAAREINRRRSPYVVNVTPGVEGATPGGGDGSHRLPTLSAEFWEHPLNAHVLAAARARRCGPDALMLNVLLRLSILIPPSFLLPPLAGGFSPLNLLGCVVGRTGEGKSVSIAAAGDVVPAEHPWLLWDMPLGTGEGTADVFMMEEWKEDDKGKKVRTGMRVQNPDLHAVHFTVDEGAALVEVGNRKGATIIPALCKAWTGTVLGETNASVSTRRRVKALSYRLSAVVNIQPINFHRLFNTANTGTGLTGRFLFAPAADYDMPDVRGIWPGELAFPTLHGSVTGNVLDYHPDIEAEVDAAIVVANRTGGTADNVSHANLLRARVAAIYCLYEDRRTVSPDDWHLARLLTDSSQAVLNHLDFQADQAASDESLRINQAKAVASTVTQEAEERIWLKKATDRVMAILLEGPLSAGHLMARMSVKQRDYLDQALLALSDIGQIRLVGERYERT